MTNLIVTIFLFTLVFFSCSSFTEIKEPVRWSGEPLKCFRERYCNYQNQNNPDKSYCSAWATECSKILDFEYCKKPENRIKIKVKTLHGIVEGDDFHAGCWDILK